MNVGVSSLTFSKSAVISDRARVGIGSGRPGLIILAQSVGAARNLAAIATHIPYFPFIHFPEGKQADGLESISRCRDARVGKCTRLLALLPLSA